jgi:malonate-semialdehyde dehydrogenase (acetylating)/methylmalonate-semialdehyde dehydrogenase
MPDADLDQAVDALMGAADGSAGERCMAISVGDEVGDELVRLLTPRVEALKVLASDNPDAEMGPLVTREHRDKVTGCVDLGVEEGARLVVDGRGYSVAGYEQEFFLGGCLFDHATPQMRIYKEKIFGPVLCVVRAPDFESALQLINDHELGNGTAIFTRDGDTARNFSSRVLASMVGINDHIPVPMAFHNFGGWKRSLFGGTHMHGPEGVHFNTRLKALPRAGLRKSAPARIFICRQ